MDPGVTNFSPFSRYGRFHCWTRSKEGPGPAPFMTETCATGTSRYELLAIFSLREVPWILALRTFARFLVTGGSGPGNLRRLWQVPAPFVTGDLRQYN